MVWRAGHLYETHWHNGRVDITRFGMGWPGWHDVFATIESEKNGV